MRNNKDDSDENDLDSLSPALLRKFGFLPSENDDGEWTLTLRKPTQNDEEMVEAELKRYWYAEEDEGMHLHRDAKRIVTAVRTTLLAELRGEREVEIGLHTHVEIRYEVDRYRAELLNENEKILAEATGETPSLALAALAALDRTE